MNECREGLKIVDFSTESLDLVRKTAFHMEKIACAKAEKQGKFGVTRA